MVLIGESYVEGFMEGEAIASLRENKFSAEEIDISEEEIKGPSQFRKLREYLQSGFARSNQDCPR